MKNANNFTEEYDYNTGIKLYGAVNNGVSTTGNEIKIDSTAVCLDFSGGTKLYRPHVDSGTILGPVETGYVFQLLQGSTVRWQARFIRSTYTKEVTGEDGQPTTETYVQKIINVNGKTTVTTNESSAYTAFQVSDFGTNTINLSDGTYTLKITRSYEWTHWKSILNMISYRSTSTLMGSLTIDTIAPVLTARGMTSGKTLASGTSTNEHVTITVSDSNHARLYYKTPSNGTFQSTTANSFTSGATNGLYTVYAVDSLGQKSEEFTFYYDDGVPIGTLYGGTATKTSGSYTNASYVKYTASDSYSGIANCYVKMPNTSYYTSYLSGTQLTTEGEYCFYAVDKSGNRSSVVTITLDKTKPTGTLYGGASVVSNGSVVNSQYIRFVPYDGIGLSATYVRKPGASLYVGYTSGTQFTDEGTYYFYSTDKAGNASTTYTGTLDRQIPAARLYVDDKPFGGGYTNGAHIRFECEETCYVKLPGSSTFVEYLSGAEYYKAGKYIFYGISEAGNSTGYYTVVIDRTVKSLTLNNVTGGKTNGDVILSWTDGDPELYAPIRTVTVNGKAYNKGESIYTIDKGVYEVVATDAAGNRWETSFESSKQNVLTKTLQKEYYEIYDINGEYFSFAGYESAFAFAVAREKLSVRTGEWNNVSWDTGIAMDAKDSVNAVNGTYFIYKKSGNADEEVAYFTSGRLNEVIAEYAKEGINHYYYWEKDPAPAAKGENLFSYSDGKTILADRIVLGENIGCLLDGEAFIGTNIEEEGKHALTVMDEWGNSCEYALTIVRKAPDILYTVDQGSGNTVTFDRTYYFKDKVTVSVSDKFDETAMFCVYDENGVLLGKLSLGETYSLTESGRYTAEAVNRFGKTETFTFVISRKAPKVEIIDNVNKKRLDIIITESGDGQSHIRTLEIYKSADNGETWVLLEKDDYGTAISVGTLSYAFRTTGLYKAILTDEFRTGIDAVAEQRDYIQPNPEGVLSGVENGGYTNRAVMFEWTDEAKVTLEKDGESLGYVSGQKLTENGEYVLTFENYDGYSVNYTFIIDTLFPEVSLVGAEDGGSVSGDVYVAFGEERLTAELFKDGESLGEYISGDIITENGAYRVVVIDLALNKTEVSFTIDKLVDFDVNVNDRGLANSVTVTAKEEVTVVLNKNGKAVEYALGDDITEPAEYVLVLMDNLGNRAEVSFVIVEPLVKEFKYNFDKVPNFERVVIGGEEKRLNYGTLELKEDGTYEVGVVVDGKTYTFTVTVDGTAPALILNGVENDGKTKGKVTFSDLSEAAEVRVYRNDAEIKCNLGDELTETGRYKVVVTDKCGNAAEYSFEIEKSASRWWIALIVIGGLAVVGCVTVFVLKKKEVL